jgi:hypothetical protein
MTHPSSQPALSGHRFKVTTPDGLTLAAARQGSASGHGDPASPRPRPESAELVAPNRRHARRNLPDHQL